MRWECQERFPRHRLQRKPLVCDPGMHLGHVRGARAVMHVRIANPRWQENVPCIPGACATRNFTYLARGPWDGDPQNTSDLRESKKVCPRLAAMICFCKWCTYVICSTTYPPCVAIYPLGCSLYFWNMKKTLFKDSVANSGSYNVVQDNDSWFNVVKDTLLEATDSLFVLITELPRSVKQSSHKCDQTVFF